MKYETPEVDFIIIDENNVFMTASGGNPLCSVDGTTTYESVGDALAAHCSSFSGAANNFLCGNFGGYSQANPPTQNTQVTIQGTTYTFDYKGNHWKEHKGNN